MKRSSLVNNGIFGWVGPISKQADPELLYEFTKQMALSVARWRGQKYCGIGTYENDGYVRVYKDPISAKEMFARDENDDLKRNICTSRIFMGSVGYDLPKNEDSILPYKLEDGKWLLSMCGEVKNSESISAICNKELGDNPETSAMLIALEHQKDSYESMRFIHSRVEGWFSIAALSLKSASLILSKESSSCLIVGKSKELGIYVYAPVERFIREAEEAVGKLGSLVGEIREVTEASFVKLVPGNMNINGEPSLEVVPKEVIAPKPLKFPNNEEYFIEIPIKREGSKLCKTG